MSDLSAIPEAELLNDLEETNADIELCKEALSQGVFIYSGGRVRERLEANQEIKAKIEAELKRRGIARAEGEVGE